MNALLAAHAQQPVAPPIGQNATQLQLFDPALPSSAAAISGSAAIAVKQTGSAP
jgi:hypothetical protein